MRSDLINKFGKIVKLNCDNKTLRELILKNEKSYLTSTGAVATFTGERTARSPKDRFIVVDNDTKNKVSWGEYNQPIKAKIFDEIQEEIIEYLSRRYVYVVDCVAGQDEQDKINITVFSELASQALFCKIMFKDVVEHKIKDFSSEYIVLSAPELKLNPKKYCINSSAFIGIDFSRKIILIAGTGYVCEIKKAIFSVFNYIKPQNNVLTMHSSANSDPDGKNSAIFFGLSGTGKTTLSNAKGRCVVADDENGWNENGLFNIENGCYAKIFELNPEVEPDIYQAIKTDAMLENVVQDAQGKPNYFNSLITENIRTAYPLKNLKNVVISGRAEAPKNIFFLTADSTGVFPPIARLNSKQIIYYFLNGFTSKMKGVEVNSSAEPQWTFSPCFGAPFMPLDIYTYANLLEKKVDEAECKVWLVNTGWTGGKYGVGKRIKLSDTRRLVDEAIQTGFKGIKFEKDDYFDLAVPTHCEGISSDTILKPVKTWSSIKEFETMVKKVKQAFHKNSKKYKIKEI
ncbi:MAG: phosphoenolpyruvate carboxykinase (ATP) [Clostridia bacterium]|nr:phosphoenolpyruvate carboxykinase (ATP) [Clostridia bacterium]